MFYPAEHAVRAGRGDLPAGAVRPLQHREPAQDLREDYDGKGMSVHARAWTRRSSTPSGRHRGRRAPVTVFVYARPGHWRNCWEMASLALEELKRRLGDGVRIVTAGAWATGEGADDDIKHLGLLDYRATGELYRNSDVGLALTVSKHPSYLPLELMACGVPVVAFDNPWGHWILGTGRTACWPSGRWTAWPTSSSGCAGTRSCGSGSRRARSRTSPRGTATGTRRSAASTGTSATPRAGAADERLIARRSVPGSSLITPEPLGGRMAGPAIRALELARALARDGRSGQVTIATLASCDPLRRRPPAGRGHGRGDTALPRLRGGVGGDPGGRARACTRGWPRWTSRSWWTPTTPSTWSSWSRPARWARPRREPSSATASGRSTSSWHAPTSCSAHRPGSGRCGSDTSRRSDGSTPLTYDLGPDLSGLVAVVPFGTPAAAVVRAGPAAPARTHARPDRRRRGARLGWRHLRVVRPRHAVAGGGPARARRPPGSGCSSWAQPTRSRAVRTAASAAREPRHGAGADPGTVCFADGWVPYDERDGWLAAADIGVSTHHEHVETEFSFRTRVVDYLWAGLPVVSTGGDELAERVTAAGAGATVPAGDVEALIEALRPLAEDAERRATMGRRAAELGAELAWSRVAAPLAEFCARPAAGAGPGPRRGRPRAGRGGWREDSRAVGLDARGRRGARGRAAPGAQAAGGATPPAGRLSDRAPGRP